MQSIKLIESFFISENFEMRGNAFTNISENKDLEIISEFTVFSITET